MTETGLNYAPSQTTNPSEIVGPGANAEGISGGDDGRRSQVKHFGHGEKFTRRQERAIVALLEQPTVEAAARVAGIGTVTLGRWMKRPDFQERFREARGRILDSTVLRLQNASGEAVEALRRAMSSGNPVAEVRAAEIVLEQVFRTVETRIDAGVALRELLKVPQVKTVLYTGEEDQESPQIQSLNSVDKRNAT